MAHYTTWGSVRGGCRHRHETLDSARRCQQHDQMAVQHFNGGPRSGSLTRAYSDRHVYLIADDGTVYNQPEGCEAEGEAVRNEVHIARIQDGYPA